MHLRSASLRIGPLLAAAVLSYPHGVHAETAARCDRGDCVYQFDDEGLNSPGPSPYADLVKARVKAARVPLIRPRVSFVMELLKTVQTL